MTGKRILGIVILVGGIVLILVSLYIKTQVEEGNMKVASTQKSVDQGNSLLSLTPVPKEIGQGLSSPIQSKINAGKEDIAHYTKLYHGLQIGGIILLILGAGIIFIGKKK